MQAAEKKSPVHQPLWTTKAERICLGECWPIAHTGTAMKPTQIGNRVVVIGNTAPANEKTSPLPPSRQPATSRRIVVIRNNEWLGSRRGR